MIRRSQFHQPNELQSKNDLIETKQTRQNKFTSLNEQHSVQDIEGIKMEFNKKNTINKMHFSQK